VSASSSPQLDNAVSTLRLSAQAAASASNFKGWVSQAQHNKLNNKIKNRIK
jgi:hypothetical protein